MAPDIEHIKGYAILGTRVKNLPADTTVKLYRRHRVSGMLEVEYGHYRHLIHESAFKLIHYGDPCPITLPAAIHSSIKNPDIPAPVAEEIMVEKCTCGRENGHSYRCPKYIALF